MTGRDVEVLDLVELRVATGRWPVGTTGTAVEVLDDAVMVEIVEDVTGRTEDLFTVPMSAVRALPRYRQEPLIKS